MIFEKNPREAYVNYALIAINVVYFLFLEIVGSSEDTKIMIQYGAVFLPEVLGKKEYWRLLTAMFMHFGIQHISNNMLILFVLGGYLERALGRIRYLIFYIVCGVGANIICLVKDLSKRELVVSAGASGAIFGVIGGLLYVVMVNRGKLEDLSSTQLIIIILFSLYFGFTTADVSNVAHIAGLLVGVLMAMVCYRKPKPHSNLMKEDLI